MWCYPPGTVTFTVGETSFSMDACMRWLRHFKTQSNSWMWVGMCKCCGKIFSPPKGGSTPPQGGVSFWTLENALSPLSQGSKGVAVQSAFSRTQPICVQ